MVQSVGSENSRDKVSLKPCPFCGSEDIHIHTYAGFGLDGSLRDRVAAVCHGCETKGPPVQVREEAARAWNARTTAWWEFTGSSTPVPVYNTTVMYDQDEIIDRLDTIIELLREEFREAWE